MLTDRVVLSWFLLLYRRRRLLQVREERVRRPHHIRRLDPLHLLRPGHARH